MKTRETQSENPPVQQGTVMHIETTRARDAGLLFMRLFYEVEGFQWIHRNQGSPLGRSTRWEKKVSQSSAVLNA